MLLRPTRSTLQQITYTLILFLCMGNNEHLRAVVAESPELQFSIADLHDKLIVYTDDLLSYDDIEDIPRPTIEIIDDTTISLNGARLKLDEGGRFALNALRLNQGFAQSGPQLRGLGYRGATELFNFHIGKLMNFCARNSENPIIERQPVSGIAKKNLGIYITPRSIHRRSQAPSAKRESSHIRGLSYVRRRGQTAVD